MRYFFLLLFSAAGIVSAFAQERSATATQPATISVQLTETQQNELKERLALPSAKVRIALSDICPPVDSIPGGLRVFLNKTDATTHSPDDAHLLATISFQPTADRSPQGFLINPVAVLRELQSRNQLDLSKPLNLTFVVDAKSSPVVLGKAEIQLP